MAAVTGVQHDPCYRRAGQGVGPRDDQRAGERWLLAVWLAARHRCGSALALCPGRSHEDYALGNYLESGIAFKESTGDTAIYASAVRAVNNMAATFLGGAIVLMRPGMRRSNKP